MARALPRPFLTALVPLGLFLACQSPEPISGRVGAQSSSVQGGKPDSTHPFAVGLSSHTGRCSGTLIAPNLVLTARHCVAPTLDANGDPSHQMICGQSQFGSPYSASTFSVTTEEDMESANTWYRGSQVIVPTAKEACGNDIALIILSKSIPSVTPATPLVDRWMTEIQYVAWNFSAIGYGITSPSGNDSGQRNIREDMDVTCVPNALDRNCFDDPAAKDAMSEKEFVALEGVCQGDSGSGAFDQAKFNDGVYVTYGIASRAGTSRDGTKCEGAVYTRTDKWRDWIIAGAKKAATAGGYTAPSWTNSTIGDEPIPPPPRDAGKPDVVKVEAAAPKALGTACKGDTECASKNCSALSTSMPFECTQACSQAKPCPTGFSCLYDLCWRDKWIPEASAPVPDAAPQPVESGAKETSTDVPDGGEPDPVEPPPDEPPPDEPSPPVPVSAPQSSSSGCTVHREGRSDGASGPFMALALLVLARSLRRPVPASRRQS